MPSRILVLNERDLANPLAGGAEVHLFEVFGRLVARGHDVTLLAATFPGCAARETIDGIDVRRLVNRYLFYAAVPFVARRVVRREGFGVVVDVLAKLPFLSPWFVPRPCIGVAHHLFGATAFQQVAFPIALATYLSEKLIPAAYRRTPIIAVSPSTADDLAARGLQRELISIVPNGIDHDVYGTNGSEKAASPLVVWLGRVEGYKRVDLLLQAVASIRERVAGIRVVIVGEGSALEKARQLVRALDLGDCVEFPGFVDSDEKVAILRRAHVLVNTSEKEGWGLTVLEGNACGTPTVASDVPGLRDSVRDGVTGLLVEHENVAQLAAALVRVLTDSELRERLSENAIAWAARFGWDAVADDVETIIEAVIAGGAPDAVRTVSPVFAD